jgi:hypothetical protein
MINKRKLSSLESHSIEFGRFTLRVKIDSEIKQIKDENAYAMKGIVSGQEIEIEQKANLIDIEQANYRIVLENGPDILEATLSSEEYVTMLNFLNRISKNPALGIY